MLDPEFCISGGDPAISSQRKSYLKARDPKLYKLFVEALGPYYLEGALSIIIPKPTVVKALWDEFESQKIPETEEDHKKWDKFISKVGVYLLKSKIDDKFKGGPVRNCSMQIMDISSLDKGKVTIKSGPTLATKAVASLVTEAAGRPAFVNDHSPIFTFLELDSGEIESNGVSTLPDKVAKKVRGGVPQIVESRELLFHAVWHDTLNTSIRTGKDHFAPLLLGLMTCLEMHDGSSDIERTKNAKDRAI